VGICVLYVLGVSFLGIVDDMLGAEPRGWRGHGRAILRGGMSTGALKAAGSLGFALFALRGRGYTSGEYLLGVGVLVLATNFFNLLDLRPGRSAKGIVLLGLVLLVSTGDAGPLNSLGVFVGPILVLGLFDLRERTMLGDTGSNLIGAVAGLWLVLSLSQTWKAIAFVVLSLLTVYGEFRSLSELIERAPLLRRLDSLGRLRSA
jgi:UDP-N-acetylmuramyl pentapeptide phosphotransferase/UDP-N-acetylglucosamine-1-phosphate transferase